MAGNALQARWAEPRPLHPPVRVWRNWVLVAVVVLWSALEAVFREDVAWRPVALTVVVVIALTLLWRRTHPLAVSIRLPAVGGAVRAGGQCRNGGRATRGLRRQPSDPRAVQPVIR